MLQLQGNQNNLKGGVKMIIVIGIFASLLTLMFVFNYCAGINNKRYDESMEALERKNYE